MKITKYFIAAVAALATLTACDSDLEKVVYSPENAKPGQLVASESDIRLTAANTKQEVLTLTWGASEYGIDLAPTYTIEMDMAEGNFSNPVVLASTTENTVNIKGKDLNAAVLKLEQQYLEAAPVYEPQNVKIRVVSSFSEDVESIYTNLANLTITPYAGKVDYAKLSVPGSHQGWDPLNYDQALYATDSNNPNVYTGYVYMAAGTEWKIADGEKGQAESNDKWSINWGSSDGVTLEPNGSNIVASEEGCYYITADIENLTLSVEKRDWFIIGDAVGGWDEANDVPMAWSSEAKALVAQVNLADGEFKFRVNHGWDINLGLDPDGEEFDLAQNGGNIKALPGLYYVTLSFADGYPTYSIVSELGGGIQWLNIPGTMNGWDPATQDNVLVATSKTTFTGNIYLTTADKFKFALGSWDDNWGSDDMKTLAANGTDMKVDADGMYTITADIDALTVAFAAHGWSIVGSAVAGDINWGTDYDLTWNAETKVLEITCELEAGEFKFRADHEWGLNYGGEPDNLQKDGANIAVEEAGTYHITLDLQTAAKHQAPTFTITKQ